LNEAAGAADATREILRDGFAMGHPEKVLDREGSW
jgi:hypothetical protein